jgi:hypothetical protein
MPLLLNGVEVTDAYLNGAALDSFNLNGVEVWAKGAAAGQAEFTTPGTYTWTAPAGVTSVCAVCIGAGGAGGGGLGWKNKISVVPGTAYTLVVGSTGGS